jgi:hypothetical protein
MVQASVVGLGNIVGDGERLKNALEAAILSVFCVAYLKFLMLTDAVLIEVDRYAITLQCAQTT